MEIQYTKDEYYVYYDGDLKAIVPYDCIDSQKVFTPREYIEYLLSTENMTYKEVCEYLIECSSISF